MGSDYTLNSNRATGSPDNRPDEVIVNFRVDRLAQEVDETAHLRLTTNTAPPPRPDAIIIFQDIIEFVIQDSDGEMYMHNTVFISIGIY